jgi:hypothetical protein
MDPIPQARIVRKGGLLVTPPRAPKPDSRVRDALRDGFAIAMGLWPLTAVLLLAVGLIIMAGNAGAR